jgi:hypothetical protein
MVGQSRSFLHCVCVATATLVFLAVHGCTDVKGGAVELSWKLRAAAGAQDVFVSCTSDGTLTNSAGAALQGTGQLKFIRLGWTGSGSDSAFVDFNCSASHGVTTFIVPPGETYLSVEPRCDGDVLPRDRTYVAPPPVVRTVIAGDTVSLGAVELVLQVSNCTQPCVCQ